jgi:hypothetical protein
MGFSLFESHQGIRVRDIDPMQIGSMKTDNLGNARFEMGKKK